VRRFQTEGWASARFKHRHAIEVYDSGELDDGTHFLATELLTGESLRDLLKREGRLAPAAAIDIVAQLLEALDAMREAAVVHRDVKPDNIKLERRDGSGRFVKLFDLGIAKIIDRAGEKQLPVPIEQMGSFFGTPEYASPEQCAGAALDGASDLYSAAVLLYECLTGALPFAAMTPQGFLALHIAGPPRRFAEVAPDLHIPAAIEAVVMRALSKRPVERYMTGALLAEALERAAVEAGVALQIATASPVETRSSSWTLVLMLIVILAATVLAALFALIFTIVR